MKRISCIKAQELINKKSAILIDVRSPVDFRDGTLPNAINMPIRRITDLLTFNKSVPVIFFGKNSTDSDLLTTLNYADQLLQHVYYLNSINDWK